MFTAFNLVKKILHGPGSIASIGEAVKRVGGSRVVIVTDKGLAGIGLHQPLCDSLRDEAIEYLVYDAAELEPNSRSIKHCVENILEFEADALIGFGGGSALDTTKAAAVLASNKGAIEDYFGLDKVTKPCLPMILVPTTAGTGSEMTSISVLTDDATGAKLGIVSDYLYADIVILDPELTLSLPPKVTAMTGVDAFVHAMESFVGNRATVFTDALNLQAMKMISANIREAYQNGFNLEAREKMLYGSALAGLGFGNTQNGIIHAIGTSVPSELKQPHGILMAAIAPMGIEFNYTARPDKYAVIGDILKGQDSSGKPVIERAEDCIDAFRALLVDLQIPAGLRPYGVKPRDLPGIAERASQARRLMDNNPRSANSSELLDLLEAQYEAIAA